MRIVLEEDQDSRAVAIAEPGNNHVKFALEERDRHGWYETAACWHEVAHLKSAIALAGQYTAFVQRIASMAGAPDAGQACRDIIAECKRQQREGAGMTTKALQRFSVKVYTDCINVLPHLACDREPGCWGEPGCVWVSFGWLRWSVQVSIRSKTNREIGRIEEEMLREAMEHYAARSEAAKRGHVTRRHNRDRIRREMAAERLDGVDNAHLTGPNGPGGDHD